MHTNTIKMLETYRHASGTRYWPENMASALAEARDTLTQITKAQDVEQARELAQTYLEVHQID